METKLAIIDPKGADITIPSKNIPSFRATTFMIRFSFPTTFKLSIIIASLVPEIKAKLNANNVSPMKNKNLFGIIPYTKGIKRNDTAASVSANSLPILSAIIPHGISKRIKARA
jgi:hypothetical protein